MLVSRFKNYLKSLFSPKVEEQPEPEPEPIVEQSPEPAEGVFSLDHEWPFDVGPKGRSVKPTDSTVAGLVKGTYKDEKTGHVFYVYNGKKCRHVRDLDGKERHQARRMVWWLEGRKDPHRVGSVRSNCGEPLCIRLDHLELGHDPALIRPKPKPVEDTPAEPEKPVTPAPVVKEVRDRTKCITAKVYFSTKEDANRVANKHNRNRSHRSPRLYTYRCPMCFGYHTTKHNPNKKYKGKVKGSWGSI